MATKPQPTGGNQPHLNTSRVNLKTVVVAVDLSFPASEKAVRIAASLAKEFEAKLILTHTLPKSISPKEMKFVQERIGRFIQAMAFEDVESKNLLQKGDVVEETEKVVEEQKADLLILATHGRRGIKKLLAGSRSESLFRSIAVPVLTVGPAGDPSFNKFHSILLATDLTPRSFRAAQYAASLAQEYDATLTILHVLDAKKEKEQPGVRANALEQMQQLVPQEAEFWCHPSFRAETGEVAEKILAVANETAADLVVMRVRHIETADRAPWAIASRVVSQAHCPVLTVRDRM
jgi:nucleotide-binding universal stress UspA family protein